MATDNANGEIICSSRVQPSKHIVSRHDRQSSSSSVDESRAHGGGPLDALGVFDRRSLRFGGRLGNIALFFESSSPLHQVHDEPMGL
jgi:hypothetical protein